MSEHVFGYARVSSKEQNLERPAYQALKGALGLWKDDTLYITSLDRLSRSKSDIRQEMQWMRDNGIRLKIPYLPTSLVEIPEGEQWIIEMIQNILIEVLSSMAEQERLTIRKRQKEGIKAAKRKGKHLGRPSLPLLDVFPDTYREWRAGKITAREVMNRTGMKKTRFYRSVRENKEESDRSGRINSTGLEENTMCNKKKIIQMKRDDIDYLRGITEHSLSVSEFNAMNKNGSIHTDLSEDISSHDLPYLPHSGQGYDDELAYQFGDRYFVIQMSEDGYDYTFYGAELEVIDGGNYDDPDISIREAADILLKEEGVGENQMSLVDHDELMEKVEQVGQKILREAREQVNCIPVISDNTFAEAALNGMSRSEIEETVWAIAQAEIMEEDLDAKIKAVRVYGSRTRKGLYQKEPDVDVVVAYEGGITEKELRCMLDEAGCKIGGMELDIKTIRLDETGTIEGFLAMAEQYPDAKMNQKTAKEE